MCKNPVTDLRKRAPHVGAPTNPYPLTPNHKPLATNHKPCLLNTTDASDERIK